LKNVLGPFKNLILLDVGEGTTAQLYQSVSGNFDRFNR
jgi:hypothetical protein